QEYKTGIPQTGVDIVKDERGKAIFPFPLPPRGTTVCFFPDETIFQQTVTFDFDSIKKLIRERAYLVPKLYFHLYDQRGEKPKEINFYFEGGITALVEKINDNKEPI